MKKTGGSSLTPKRRLFEVLKSQGHQMNQQLTFLSDGGDRGSRAIAVKTLGLVAQ
jgi:hypothetical protein